MNIMFMTIMQPLVIGNWKQHPDTVDEAIILAKKVATLSRKSLEEIAVSIAPPHAFLSDVHKALGKSSILVACQGVSSYERGAHTGEVSASMVQSVGVQQVIVGHSEQRLNGVTNEMVAGALQQVIKSNLIPVLCIGEFERDTQGDFYAHIETQLFTALQVIAKSKIQHVVVAYEPIWAIGTGETATAEIILEMKLYIQKVLITHFGRAIASKVRILYGGSVNEVVAKSLIEESEVHGFLVGGASLKPEEFVKIISIVHSNYVARKNS